MPGSIRFHLVPAQVAVLAHPFVAVLCLQAAKPIFSKNS